MCSPSRKYALGVILLQLATGLPAIIQVDKNSSPRLLSDYLRAMQASRIITRFDPRCSGWSPTGDADPFSNGRVLEGLLRLGLRCTEDDRNARLPVADIQLALHDLSTPGGGPTQYFSREENMQPFGDEARVCCICGEAPRAVTFLPCRHSVACNGCSLKLEGTFLGEGGASSTRGSDSREARSAEAYFELPSAGSSAGASSPGPRRVAACACPVCGLSVTETCPVAALAAAGDRFSPVPLPEAVAVGAASGGYSPPGSAASLPPGALFVGEEFSLQAWLKTRNVPVPPPSLLQQARPGAAAQAAAVWPSSQPEPFRGHPGEELSFAFNR